MIFVAGIGSLLNASGINEHGLSRKYVTSDVASARLVGYLRCYNATDKDGIRYLGLLKDPGSYLNVGLFQLDVRDVFALCNAEGFFPTKAELYDLTEVTSHIRDFKLNRGDHVYSFVTRTPNDGGKVSAEYVSEVARLAADHGPYFAREFTRTTRSY